ncbi:MAG: type II secretion system protein J [Phycisphaerales bacterium JB063]
MLPHKPTPTKRATRRKSGLTLAESMLSMTILSVVMTAVLHATVAGHQHMQNSAVQLDAVRVAELLLEEARSRAYQGSGATRSDYRLPDYHGLTETPGDLRDATGALCPDAFQGFERTAQVVDDTVALSGLDSIALPVRRVRVTVSDQTSSSAELNSIIVEPYTP